ncbi:MAG: GlmU family protein [Candidatus Aureabacteria bacterium]|nr:GlmU family protein [Candidatus Auribacterota bacterium]
MNKANICIFEDANYVNLLPLVYMRPVYELRCGIDLLMDKIIRKYPGSDIILLCRDYLADTLKEKHKYRVNPAKYPQGATLFINGRLLLNKTIAFAGKEEVVFSENSILYARLGRENAGIMTSKNIISGEALRVLKLRVPCREAADGKLFNYSWEFIKANAGQIRIDFKDIAGKGRILGKVFEGVHLINRKDIFIDKGAVIKPGVVLDAEGGPIYIGKGVKILPNAVIEGPSYIGDKCTVKIGAKIYEGTSIGEVCKAGGEIEESIIHSYSNKQHEGFLGHAYIGQWCNIAADTNDSDLKNNYSNVRVYVNGKFVDTGEMFVGLTMGDHSKTGINSMFNTGTVVGINVNIFGAQLPPKFVPSFTWGASGAFVVYQPDKALKVAERVMARRKVELTNAQKELFRYLYKLTEKERVLTRIEGDLSLGE